MAPNTGQQVAYATIRINGQKRRCAIFRTDRETGLNDLTASALQDAPRSPPLPATDEPTTTTGSIPYPPGRGGQKLRLAHSRAARRLPTWEHVWSYGTSMRVPRPIRKRLARMGVVTSPTLRGPPGRRRGRP